MCNVLSVKPSFQNMTKMLFQALSLDYNEVEDPYLLTLIITSPQTIPQTQLLNILALMTSICKL